MNNLTITIPWYRWVRLILELKRRGEGLRESGALLLAKKNQRRVVEVLYYDDLDPKCLDTGIVRLNGSALVAAWEYCRRKSLTIVADLHTHPTADTRQSESDKQNPIVRDKHHTAIIVPRFAQGSHFSLSGVSTYDYLTNKEWRSCSPSEKRLKLVAL